MIDDKWRFLLYPFFGAVGLFLSGMVLMILAIPFKLAFEAVLLYGWQCLLVVPVLIVLYFAGKLVWFTLDYFESKNTDEATPSALHDEGTL